MATFASVEQAAASLVDFSQPMDVSVLERIVETAYQVSPRAEARGPHHCRAFKSARGERRRLSHLLL